MMQGPTNVQASNGPGMVDGPVSFRSLQRVRCRGFGEIDPRTGSPAMPEPLSAEATGTAIGRFRRFITGGADIRDKNPLPHTPASESTLTHTSPTHRHTRSCPAADEWSL